MARGRGRGRPPRFPRVNHEAQGSGTAHQGPNQTEEITLLRQQIEASRQQTEASRQQLEMNRQQLEVQQRIIELLMNERGAANEGNGRGTERRALPAPVNEQAEQGQGALAMAVAPAPVGRPEPLLIQLRKINAPQFDGVNRDPLKAQGWFKTIENMLRLMGLTDNEKVQCASYCLIDDARIWWETVELRRNIDTMTWAQFTEVFNEKYFNANLTSEYWDRFNSLRQGARSVTEAVTEFDRLARLCPELVSTERERVRRMIKMLRPEIAAHLDAHPPTTAEECCSVALRVEYQLNRDKGETTQTSQPQQRQSESQSNTSRPPQNPSRPWRGNGKRRNFPGQNWQGGNLPQNKQAKRPMCPKCGGWHAGECKVEIRRCYNCGQAGHLAKACPHPPRQLPTTPQSQPPRNRLAFLQNIQAASESPTVDQVRVELPPSETNARVFAFTRKDAAEASNVVTGQIYVYSKVAHALFDTGATHSFVAKNFTRRLEVPQEVGV